MEFDESHFLMRYVQYKRITNGKMAGRPFRKTFAATFRNSE